MSMALRDESTPYLLAKESQPNVVPSLYIEFWQSPIGKKHELTILVLLTAIMITPEPF
jgi:hypothetical protein